MGLFHDLSYTIENCGGVIGICFQSFRGGHTGEHQDRGHAALHTGDYVCVHPVAYHNGVGGVTIQHAQSGTHHQRVGFSAEVGLCAGGHFNRSQQRPAGLAEKPIDIDRAVF